MINLMPPGLKESIKYGSLNISAVQYIVLILVSGFALAAVIGFGVQIVRSDEAKLNASINAKKLQLEDYSEDIESAKILSAKIDTVDILLDNELKFSALVQEIGSLMPPGSSLSNLYLTNDLSENLNLSARVQTEQVATQLQQNLANSKLFSGADIQTLVVNDAGGFSVELLVSYDVDAVRAGL